MSYLEGTPSSGSAADTGASGAAADTGACGAAAPLRTPGQRMAWMVGGLLVLALGVTLLLEARLGLPPWDVLIFGSARLLGVSPVVTRLVLIAGVLAVMRLLGDRADLRVLLVPAVFGPMVSGWLTVVPAPGSLSWRAVALVAGVVLCGLGLAGYVSGRVLVGPSDTVCELVALRVARPLWQARVLVEGGVLVLGILAGGIAGLGTLCYALGSGPVMHATLVGLGHPPVAPDRAGSRRPR